MSLSLDHRLTPVCELASQWDLVCPTEVLKSLKFPRLISVLSACADDFVHAHMNF